MKIKSTIAAAVLLTAPLGVLAQNPNVAPAPAGGAGPANPMLQNPLRKGERIPTGPQIEMKMQQIELDVALKQFEKTAVALAEARSETQLLDQGTLDEAAFKELLSKTERKLQRLAQMKAELEKEIRGKIEVIEDYRKKYAIVDAPVPQLLDPPTAVNRPVPGLDVAPPTALPAPVTVERRPALPAVQPPSPAAPSTTPPIPN